MYYVNSKFVEITHRGGLLLINVNRVLLLQVSYFNDACRNIIKPREDEGLLRITLTDLCETKYLHFDSLKEAQEAYNLIKKELKKEPPTITTNNLDLLEAQLNNEE